MICASGETWDDLRLAVKLIFSIEFCECEICATIAELTRNPEVVEFTKTDAYAADKLPVDTAMCDNFKGWGNFALHSLGIPTNLCHPHATGENYLSHLVIFASDVLSGSHCGGAVFASQVLPDLTAYGAYYYFQNEISEIGVETFATRMQERLVVHLRETYGDTCANWAESFWTGSR
jgi:hypothetical protein